MLIIVLATVVGTYVMLCLAVFFLQDVMLVPGASRPAGALEKLDRVDVRTLRTEGGLRYRVAVGQFPRQSDAVSARNRLAGGALPLDTWMVRLRRGF